MEQPSDWVDWTFTDDTLEHWGERFAEHRRAIAFDVASHWSGDFGDFPSEDWVSGKACLEVVRELLTAMFGEAELENTASQIESEALPAEDG